MAAAMVIVGSTVVAGKIIGEGMPPFTATAVRFAIATPIFVLLLRLSRHRLPRLSRRDWGLLVVQAGAGSVAYTVLLIVGLTFTSAANAGVVVGTLPVVMGVVAIVGFGERPTWRFVAALAVASAGVLLITIRIGGGGVSMPSLRDAVGIGLVLTAVLCEALFLLLNKRLARPLPALTLSALMSGLGLALVLVPAAIEAAAVGWDGVTGAAMLGVVYYALVPTVVGFFLWYEGAARASAGEAALFTAVLPVSAVVLAALVLAEPVTLQQAAGCACVIVAILIGLDR